MRIRSHLHLQKILLNAQWEKSLLYRQYTTQPSKSDPTLEYRTFWCHYTIGNIGEKTIYSKSFSPIPVALLILNNLPQDLIFSPDIKSFVLQNQLNIGLLVILGIYTYHLFSTFSAQKQIITHISKIKKELFLLSSQDSELSISNSRNNPEPP